MGVWNMIKLILTLVMVLILAGCIGLAEACRKTNSNLGSCLGCIFHIIMLISLIILAIIAFNV